MNSDSPSVPTAASRTPLHIGAVGLAVRDLDGLAAYYRELLGLEVQRSTAQSALLGVAGVPLLELNLRPGAQPDDEREAGLYHTAFLMPSRADLARWILHVAKKRFPVSGASDHDVSEAIYLDDPEGNGIEVYSDRPATLWRRDGKTIFQKTDPLDIDAIVREVDPATASYPQAPAGLRVGHIHLRVGSIEQAERFYCGVLGMDVTRRRTGATFISSEGYHHHVGANVWHSIGAGRRAAGRTGLEWFGIEAADRAALDAARDRLAADGIPVESIAGGFAARDTSGIEVRFTVAAQAAET